MPTHKYDVPDRGAPLHLDEKQDLGPHIAKAAEELKAAQDRELAKQKAAAVESHTVPVEAPPVAPRPTPSSPPKKGEA